jgi:hypothetical protein
MAAGLSFYSPPAISCPELMVPQRRPVELALRPVDVEMDADVDVEVRWPSWNGCASKTGDSDGGCTWVTASEGGPPDVDERASTPDGVEAVAVVGESGVLDGAAEEELQRIVEAAATRKPDPPSHSTSHSPLRPSSHHRPDMPDPPGTPTWWHYFYSHPLSCHPVLNSRQSLPACPHPLLDHRQQQPLEEDPALVVAQKRKGKRRRRWDLGAFGDVVRCVGAGVLWVVSCGGLLDCRRCARRRAKVG